LGGTVSQWNDTKVDRQLAALAPTASEAYFAAGWAVAADWAGDQFGKELTREPKWQAAIETFVHVQIAGRMAGNSSLKNPRREQIRRD